MPTPNDDSLAELTALREENVRLRESLRQAHDGKRIPKSGGRWRTAVAIPLIALGAILVPVALASTWAATELTNADRFVASLAPLTHDPSVRDYLGDEIVEAVENSVDIDQLTQDAFDGLAESGLPPRAATAIAALAPAAADGIRNLLGSAVHKVIDSPRFQTVWDKTLRLSQKQLVQVLNDDQSAALVVADNGEVGIQLEPVLQRVKSQLVAAQFPFADKIPVVQATIPIGTVTGIAPLRAAYRALLWLAAFAPWLCVALLAIGVATARSHVRAAVGAGLGGAIAGLALLLALVVGRILLSNQASALGVPAGVTQSLFDSLTLTLRGACLAAVLAGLLIAIVGILSGGSTPATALRRFVGRGFDAANRFLEARRISARPVGDALHRVRYAVWTGLCAAAVIVVVLSRPLTPALVGWAALVVAACCALFALFEHRPTAAIDPTEAR